MTAGTTMAVAPIAPPMDLNGSMHESCNASDALHQQKSDTGSVHSSVSVSMKHQHHQHGDIMVNTTIGVVSPMSAQKSDVSTQSSGAQSSGGMSSSNSAQGNDSSGANNIQQLENTTATPNIDFQNCENGLEQMAMKLLEPMAGSAVQAVASNLGAVLNSPLLETHMVECQEEANKAKGYTTVTNPDGSVVTKDKDGNIVPNAICTSQNQNNSELDLSNFNLPSFIGSSLNLTTLAGGQTPLRLLTGLGFGTASGMAAGVACKKAGRAVAVGVGGLYCMFQVANYYGYIMINWKKIQQDTLKYLDVNHDGKIDEKDLSIFMRTVIRVLGHGTNDLDEKSQNPQDQLAILMKNTGSFASGFMLGLQRG